MIMAREYVVVIALCITLLACCVATAAATVCSTCNSDSQFISPIVCEPCTFTTTPARPFFQCFVQRVSTCHAETHVIANVGEHSGVRTVPYNDEIVSSTAVVACRPSVWLEYDVKLSPTMQLSDVRKPMSQSAADCYNPDGTDCTWYYDCLEAKFPCRGSGYSYATDFGGKFCRLFIDGEKHFSAVGRRWLNAVRKCLQVELVKRVLMAAKRPTCEQIRRTAFDTHPPCWLGQLPVPGNPSVCNIRARDWLWLTWTLRSAFFDHTTAGEVVRGALDILRSCA